jgi:tungstate transport system ATP-binding protein
LKLHLANLSVIKGEIEICRVIALGIEERERLLIRGDNGSGKTTLLRVLCGLEHDFFGTIESDLTARDCVFVHQSPYLFRRSVLQNVMYGLAARSFDRSRQVELATYWLSLFGASGLADRQVDELSGGEQRRVALARAFALRPKLLLLDEPFSDQDESGSDAIRTAIATIPETTVVVTSPVEGPPILNGATLLELSRPAE